VALSWFIKSGTVALRINRVVRTIAAHLKQEVTTLTITLESQVFTKYYIYYLWIMNEYTTG